MVVVDVRLFPLAGRRLRSYSRDRRNSILVTQGLDHECGERHAVAGPAQGRRRTRTTGALARARSAVPRLRARAARAAVDRDRRPDADASAPAGRARTSGAGNAWWRSPRRPGASCRWAAAASAARSRWPIPSLGGKPYATPTLWAAIQYLMPGENAPEHRHTQHAFRFVVEGEGVWTVVNGDAGAHVARRLPAASRRGTGMSHHNAASAPMAWIDGLDIPFSYYTESPVLRVRARSAPALETGRRRERSRSERLWGYPGLRPVSQPDAPSATPLLAYRWADTDRALREQLALEAEGHAGTLSPATRQCDSPIPTTGGDVLPTIRAEMHRIRRGAGTARGGRSARRCTRCSTASARSRSANATWTVERGDMFVVPSWAPFTAAADCWRHRPRPVPVQRLADLRGAARPSRPRRGSSRGYGMSIITLARLGLAAWLAFACGLSSAQQYPAKPVRILTPFPGGSGPDAVCASSARSSRSCGDSRSSSRTVRARTASSRSRRRRRRRLTATRWCRWTTRTWHSSV